MGQRHQWTTVVALLLILAFAAIPVVQGDIVRDAESHLVACCDPDDHKLPMELTHSNLGGTGPDAGERSLRYTHVPAGLGAQVDLIVTATSHYTPADAGKNGLSGEMMHVNVKAGTSVDLAFRFRSAADGTKVTAHEAVLHIFDLDEGAGGTSRTGISAWGFADSYIDATNRLQKTQEADGRTWFVSSSSGTVDDAPTHFDSLTEQQLDKAVAFRYVDVPSINVTCKVTPGEIDHDFVFSVKLCTACGAADSWSTSSSSSSSSGALSSQGSAGGEMQGGGTHGGASIGGAALQNEATGGALADTAAEGSPGGAVWQGGGGGAQGGLALQGSADGSFVGDGGNHDFWQVSDSRVCKGQEIEWTSCPDLPQCNQCVPKDCRFAAWDQWYDAGGCTGLCFRHRDESQPNNECGKPCNGVVMETKKCVKRECMPKLPQDGAFSAWGPWSICQEHQRHRTRQVDVYPLNGGEPVRGPLREVQPCGQEQPHDCLLSEWGVWTSCSATCGEGWHNRMRRIVRFAGDGGRPCVGSLRQMSRCDARPCGGKSCRLGPWSPWEGCGSRSPRQSFRRRTVEREASGDGTPCRGLVRQTKPCPEPQPADCTVSPWEEWRRCDRTCGGGQTYRERRLAALPSDGGRCPDTNLREVRPCRTQPCDEEKDCRVSEWCSWSKCSAKCDQGIHKRTRKILQRASSTGKGCSQALEEVRSCQSKDASCSGRTDCVWGDWNEWSACTCTCGGGTKRRNRQVVVAPRAGGQLCAVQDKSEAAPCHTEPCNEQCIDGQWGEWSPWTDCSATCGNGFKWRHRDVAQQSSSCGKPAVGKAQEWELCQGSSGSSGTDAESCGDRDCILSSWNEWSDCSCTCFGVRERQRIISQFHAGRGRPCVDQQLKQVAPCNPAASAPVPEGCESSRHDCVLGHWSAWSECPVTCGGGNRERARHILTPTMNGGAPCRAALEETAPCAVAACDAARCVDCLWAAWSEWGQCSKCGDQRYRQRGIRRLPNHCGRRCEPRVAKEVSNCTSHCDKTRFCAWRPWSAWSGCSADCGSATRMRQRALGLSKARPSGEVLFEVDIHDGTATCAGTQVDLEQCPYRPCVEGCTPQGCEFGPWSDWQEPTCIGLCERARVISRMNNECGPPCDGSLVETKRCTGSCATPRDCKFSPWREWSQPDAEGSGGQLYRTRSVVQVPLNSGKACVGALWETISKENEVEPPSPCLPGDWADWSMCSRTCGGGWSERSRTLTRLASDGGAPCDLSLRQGRNCSTQSCGEVDCIVGAWEAWSGCLSYGQQFRQRQIEQQPSIGGRPCSSASRGQASSTVPLGETRPCGPAQQDCVVSHWTAWDGCDKSCGGGEQQRHRQVQAYPAHGGQPCPENLRELRGCSTRPCHAEDCVVSSWGDWERCSVTCGTGQQERRREVLRRAKGAGRPCHAVLSATRDCFDEAGGRLPSCGKTDCVWGDWSDWSDCSCTCSGGQRNRIRHISRVPQDGGAMCTPLPKEQLEPCSTQPCNQVHCLDGVWGMWDDWSHCSKSCGGGVTWRHRSLRQEANECGKPAEGLSRDTKPCNADVSCEKDIDCQWSAWSQWSDCTRTCDGVMRRSRRILVIGRGHGSWCIGASKETSPCNPAGGQPPPKGCLPSAKEDCLLGSWGAWSECDCTCGGGQVRRERSIMREARHGGQGCGGALSETRVCAATPCPAPKETVDCAWGSWSDWGACSKCGGQRTRFRHVLREPRNGGKPCEEGAAEEMDRCPRQCNEPSYCVWGEWGSYSRCSDTCGSGGKRSRQRRLVFKTASELQDLGLLYEARAGPGSQGGQPAAWLLPQGLRMEVLLAFACGYFGRVAFLAGSRAWGRRSQRARSAATPRSTAASGRRSGWSRSWFGSGGGGLLAGLIHGTEAAAGGYQPVLQTPASSELEA